MMFKKLLLLVLGMALVAGLGAQKSMSWKKHRKLADELMDKGNYYEAADHYEQAWQQKQSKTELIFLAAEAYYRVNDYRKAAEAYQHAQDKTDLDPLVGLKYARSLKQDGQYDKAVEVFRKAADSYTGKDKAILEDIIQAEIAGAQMAGTLAAQPDRSIELIYPGSNINSDAEDFAPFPVTPDLVFFSSGMGGKARIYSSQRLGNTWSKADIPGNFPVIQGGQYANGCLSPDGDRFYFTICNADKNWENLQTRCELFVIKREGVGWTQPERLPDYINAKGVNSTMPFVAHQAGLELLYFSSNREGGRGGMDLWYTTRDLGANNNDFTFPVNLGPMINTLGEEITPFYDQEEGLLYFSSNGHTNVGGFDIFKARGEEVNWTKPENLGFPLNSSANDYGFVMNRARTGGFFVSNRAFGGEKTNTRNADIFEFAIGGRRITLKGNVYDKATGGLLNDVQVLLFQIFDDGTENELVNKNFPSGSYLFELMANRRFKVVIQKRGYSPGSYSFVTDDPTSFTYGQPVFLEPGGAPATARPVPQPPATQPTVVNRPPETPIAPPVTTTAPGETYTARGGAPKDNLEYVTAAPRHQGIYFKIQLAAVGRYSADKFSKAQNLGRIDTEELTSQSLTRVLIGDFFSESDAKTALRKAQGAGFGNAYIVRYEDGVRYGKVRL